MPRLNLYCTRTFRAFISDEAGFIISAELVLISTLCVLGLVTGLSCIKSAISGEMNDLATAFKGLDQSYYYSGMHGCRSCKCGYHSYTAGSSFFQDNRKEERATFLEIEREYLREEEEFRAKCRPCDKHVKPEPQPLTPPPVETPVPTIPCPVIPESVPPVPLITPVPETNSTPITPCNPNNLNVIPSSPCRESALTTSQPHCAPPVTSYYLGHGYPQIAGPGIGLITTGPVYPPAYPLSGRRIINPDSAYQSMPVYCH